MIGDAAATVHPSNAEAARAWNGGDGAYWAEHEEAFDRSVGAYDGRFFAAARIGRSDRVLDIGCGTGRTTREAARLAADGAALGVDLSSAMIARARLRAAEEDLTNARFEQSDAQIAAFPPAGFDVAISRTGAMFFGDPVAAFRNIAAALRPGGRLALLVWQALADNRWMVEFAGALAAGRPIPSPPPDAPGPFSLADPVRVRAVLAAGGFTDIALEDAREPMDFGADADAAFGFVSGLGIVRFLLRDLDDGAQERALDTLRASIDAHAGPDGVRYPSAAWIVTARRS